MLFQAPMLIQGPGYHVPILDNLDYNLPINKILVESGQWFGSLHAVIPNMLDGVPRNSLGSEFNLQLLLEYALDSYWAYAVNEIFVHMIALIGMYLLLSGHFNIRSRWLSAGIAVLFALLPFLSSVGATVAAQPLALYAFLHIRNGNNRRRDWLILAAIPFYSSLVLGFSFFLALMLGLFGYDLVTNKRVNKPFFAAICLMSFVYVLVEYRLLLSTFIDRFPTHRIEKEISTMSFTQSLHNGWDNFLNGQFHVYTFHKPIMLGAIILGIIVSALQYRTYKKQLILQVALLALIFIISMWYGFWSYWGWAGLREHIELLKTANFSRFHWLDPLLWYSLFALSLRAITQFRPSGSYAAALLIVAQLLVIGQANAASAKNNVYSFQEYYSVKLFDSIKAYIGKDPSDYRVLSIGLWPSIPQYNGMYTLDGYLTNYDLNYKHRFREIIEKELDKNEDLKTYFDKWGNRCYIFINELPGRKFYFDKKENAVIHNLELRLDKLKEMKADYILSTAFIENAPANGLQLQRVFEETDSPWRIFLYQVM
ncbi:hypothetical protein B5M42_011910 [Paenibacillus athensensis]|uniref:Glycosyltransferase RgtA/B/C/D-like domain-containing protein n=1 Tax=Paenibacillus athensensis TaxID=1967502 RepID=A0A4Y8Q5D9_9BACL|nr:hypothetical protein [Paenibacillus athensensis]